MLLKVIPSQIATQGIHRRIPDSLQEKPKSSLNQQKEIQTMQFQDNNAINLIGMERELKYFWRFQTCD